MVPAIYVGLVIVAAALGFFLGERYGKREVDYVKAQLASSRKALDFTLENMNKKLQEDAKDATNKIIEKL